MTVTGGKHVLAYYVSCVGVRPRAVACAAHTHSLRRVRVRGVRAYMGKTVRYLLENRENSLFSAEFGKQWKTVVENSGKQRY